jgi:hypothetical protein
MNLIWSARAQLDTGLVVPTVGVAVGRAGIILDITIVHTIDITIENMRYGDILSALLLPTPTILPITRNNSNMYTKTMISPKAIAHSAIIGNIIKNNKAPHRVTPVILINSSLHPTKIGNNIMAAQNQSDPESPVNIPNSVMSILDMIERFIDIMYVKYRRV